MHHRHLTKLLQDGTSKIRNLLSVGTNPINIERVANDNQQHNKLKYFFMSRYSLSLRCKTSPYLIRVTRKKTRSKESDAFSLVCSVASAPASVKIRLRADVDCHNKPGGEPDRLGSTPAATIGSTYFSRGHRLLGPMGDVSSCVGKRSLAAGRYNCDKIEHRWLIFFLQPLLA